MVADFLEKSIQKVSHVASMFQVHGGEEIVLSNRRGAEGSEIANVAVALSPTECTGTPSVLRRP